MTPSPRNATFAIVVLPSECSLTVLEQEAESAKRFSDGST